MLLVPIHNAIQASCLYDFGRTSLTVNWFIKQFLFMVNSAFVKYFKNFDLQIEMLNSEIRSLMMDNIKLSKQGTRGIK